MDNEQEFSEFAKKQYQESKKIKRTKVALDQSQVLVFARLLSRNSPLIDYEDKLGLTFGDVEQQKDMLGLHSPGDAQAFLKAINEADDTDLLKRKQVEKEEREAAAKREEQAKEEAKPKKRGRGRPKGSKKRKEYNTTKMQKQLDAQQPTVTSKFRAEDEEKFKVDARKGINFLVDKYGIERKDAVAELSRLKIDPNMLPR